MVFAKAPIAGVAKTRLIPALGKQGAADLHGQLLDHTLAWASNGCADIVQLWSPDVEHPVLLQTQMPLFSQCGDDLGQRMAHAFEHALESAKAAVIIGTDCPALTKDIVAEAFAALESGSDVVLGPAEDGGYYLIGLKHAAPELFAGIEWGGDRVFVDTIAKLEQAQLSCHALPTLWDVDRPEDLQRLLAEFPTL